jgi:hypothetical protein
MTPFGHREVIDRITLDRHIRAAVQELLPAQCARRIRVQAHPRVHQEQVRPDPLHEVCIGTGEDHGRAVGEFQELAILRRLVARVDRTPHGTDAADAEDAGERGGIVAGDDRDLVTGPDPAGYQPRGDRNGHLLHLPITARLSVRREARRVRVDGRALVEEVCEAHGRLHSISPGP